MEEQNSSPHFIGYARVSTKDQKLENQQHELIESGCTRIYSEKISGSRSNRPELMRMLEYLRNGDVVVVKRLDRLARSVKDLLAIVERIQAAGAGIKSLAEPWADTTSPAGRMVLTVMAGVAEFERDLIRTRTSEGRAAYVAAGGKLGRRPRLTDRQRSHIRELAKDGLSIRDIAARTGIGRGTVHRALQE